MPEGFLFSGINCGIKKKNPDLGMIYCQDFCKAEGVFTENVNPSYSVLACKKNINNPIKAILVNSGNANCHSHKTGLKDTEEIIYELSLALGVEKKNILIASTGIIGKKLPKNTVIKSLPELIKNLKRNSRDFAGSILTTDTFNKFSCTDINLSGRHGSIAGFAKGAGMICPNLATMLSFVVTDISVPDEIFKTVVRESVEESFNSISVDGCMSTNDTVLVVSSRKICVSSRKEIDIFCKGLKKVCLDLAKMIVRDAEGATKFVEISIKGAKTGSEAKKAGMSLANSNLFKCALYGNQWNWGRIISALGQAGIKAGENVIITSSNLKKKNVNISIDLKRGKSCWKVYTSDLTPDYVKINADYS